MSKKHKKGQQRKNRDEDINLAQIPHAQVSKLGSNIFNALSKNQHLQEHTEPDSYQVIFAEYNNSICELHKLNKQLARKLIERFQEITKLKYSTIKNWTRSGVKNAGKYKSLFSKLNPDADVYEKEFGKEARIFFHTVGNYFCIISIKVKHF